MFRVTALRDGAADWLHCANGWSVWLATVANNSGGDIPSFAQTTKRTCPRLESGRSPPEYQTEKLR